MLVGSPIEGGCIAGSGQCSNVKYFKTYATKFSGKLPHLYTESEMHVGKQQAKQIMKCISEQIQTGDGFGQCMNNEQRCAGQGEKTDKGNARGGVRREIKERG